MASTGWLAHSLGGKHRVFDMSFEDRFFGVLYAIGDMIARVPDWLWWIFLILSMALTVLAVVAKGWAVLDDFIRFVDRLNDVVGRATAWLMVFVVLSAFTMVFVRYVMSVGAVWTNDMIIWPHGIAFMLAAGYTLLNSEHVRVDIFYAKASARRRAVIDIFGTIFFLLPWLITVAYVATPYALSSWSIMESSDQTGGLPAVYFVKSAIPMFCFLLGLQGLAMIARGVLVLIGYAGYGDETEPALSHG